MNETFRKFLSKVDTVLNAINTTSIHEDIPLNTLWKEYLNCSAAYIDDNCRTIGRATWKHTLKFISTTFGNITEDLYTYFKESNGEYCGCNNSEGTSLHKLLFLYHNPFCFNRN